MLAKLFNNISIQSLVRAMFFVMLMILSAWLLVPVPLVELSLLAWDVGFSAVLFKSLLAVDLVVFSWYFNSRINKVGFLKNDYQLIPVLGLMLTPVLFQVADPELLLLLPLGLFILIRLFELVETINPSYILFDSGVLVALMTIIAPECSFFLLLIWIATLNFGHLTVRTFLMPVIGISAILFMLFTLLYWIFGLNAFELYISNFQHLKPGYHPGGFEYWWEFIPVVLLALPAFLETVQVYGKASVKKRQIFTFLIVLMLASAAAGFFMRKHAIGWVWVLMPLAIFFVNLLHYQRKNWHKNLVYGFLMLALFLSLLF